MPTILTSSGDDAIKGGKFFGSSLTPNGVFSNIPNSTIVTNSNNVISPNIILTLEQIKNSLNSQITSSDSSLSDNAMTVFLSKYTQLLIDNEDIRNTVFFGSSYTELSYQISYLSESYPYKAFIARILNEQGEENLIEPYIRGLNTYFYFSLKEDTIFKGLISFTNNGNYNWTQNYDIIDKENNRYPISNFNIFKTGIIGSVSPYTSEDVEFGYVIEIQTPETYKLGGIITFYEDDTLNTKLGEATIIKDKQYPFYSIDRIYTVVDFINMSSELEDLEILQRGKTAVLSYTSNNIQTTEITSLGDPIEIKLDTNLGFPQHIKENDKVSFVRNYFVNTGFGAIEEIVEYYETIAVLRIKDISVIGSETIITFFTPDLVEDTYYDIEQFIEDNVYEIKMVLPDDILNVQINGRLTQANYISYKTPDELSLTYKGFLLSPNLEYIIDYENQLDGVQKALLNFLNPTPWPREPITNNIIIEGDDFKHWIQNPDNMVKDKSNTDFSYYRETEDDSNNLIGAIDLDQNVTNQLIRRCIPHELINEMNESESNMFTRYVLLAGKMFDYIKIYIDFLQYTHTLNYSEFNQLSPEFYKLYSDHYGIKLYDENQEDYLNTLILDQTNTRSSMYTDNQVLLDNSKLREFSQKRQKYLLVNLLYLYSKKGTIACIESLINLLGSPNGLTNIYEYEYYWNNAEGFGYKQSNNEKVNVPNITYTIDTSKFVNKTNPSSPENKPYHYKPVYDNENIYNLREISLNMDPTEAIANDISKYLQNIKQYVLFKQNSYLNLQPIERNGINNPEYYALPLSFPEKFSGVSIDYFIDKDSPDNLNKAKFQLCGLYKLDELNKYGEYDVTYTSVIDNVYFNISDNLMYEEETFDTLIIGNVSFKYHAVNTSSYYSYNGSIFIIENDVNYAEGISIDKIKNYYTYQIPLLRDLDEKVSWTRENSKITVYSKFHGYVTGDEINVTYISNLIQTIGLKQITRLDSDTFTFNCIDDGDLNGSLAYENKVYREIYGGMSEFYSWNNNISLFLPNKYPTDEVPAPVNANYKVSPASEYIIASLEENDLVVRLRLRSKAPGSTGIYDRVAICQNIFNCDGLYHCIKLTYRLEGIEIFKDYKFYDFIPWRECFEDVPKTPEQIATENFLGSSCFPKADILKRRVLPLNSLELLGNDPISVEYNNELQWWDLFTGMPVNINMYVHKIAVYEKLYINQPDIEDTNLTNTLGNEIEKWWFNFSDQEKINDEYVNDYIKIIANYRSSLPSTSVASSVAYKTNSFFNLNSNLVELSNVNRSNFNSLFKNYPNPVFIETSLNAVETILNNNFVKNIIKENGWTNAIHEDYTYINLESIINNYYTFSDTVLNYLDLLRYSKNTSLKFENIIKQFIPIVINITGFNLIYNFFISKYRYPKAFFKNEGHYLNSPSHSSFKVLATKTNQTFVVNIIDKNDNVVIENLIRYNTGNNNNLYSLVTNLMNSISSEFSDYITCIHNGLDVYLSLGNENSVNLQNFVNQYGNPSTLYLQIGFETNGAFSTTNTDGESIYSYISTPKDLSACHEETYGSNDLIVWYSEPKEIIPSNYIYWTRENGFDIYIYDKNEAAEITVNKQLYAK